MRQEVDIRKAGAVIIRDRHYLLTRTYGKDTFVCPGGKLEPGESAIQALIRELDEELGIVAKEDGCQLLGTYQAEAAGGSGKLLEMKVYLVDDYIGEPQASSEIEEIRWVTSGTPDILQGSIFEHEVVPKLVSLGLID